MGLLHDWQYAVDWLFHERWSFSFWSTVSCSPCSLPQMQSTRSFSHKLEWLKVAPGLLVRHISFALLEGMSMLRSQVILEHGPCAGEMMSIVSQMVCSQFFTRSNTSSMTAKFISWIVHIALCILLSTNSGSVILLAQGLWELFEIASQMKVGRACSGSELLHL